MGDSFVMGGSYSADRFLMVSMSRPDIFWISSTGIPSARALRAFSSNSLSLSSLPSGIPSCFAVTSLLCIAAVIQCSSMGGCSMIWNNVGRGLLRLSTKLVLM